MTKILQYKRKEGITAQPVIYKGEIFDKIYLTKGALENKLKENKVNHSLPTINKMIESGEILEFRIRDRDVFIIRNEFIKYLIS